MVNKKKKKINQIESHVLSCLPLEGILLKAS